MPSIIDPNGVQRTQPGAYGALRIALDLPGPAPAFNVPMLIGQGSQGIPFDVADDASRFSFEATIGWHHHASSTSLAGEVGPDAPLTIAMSYAKRHRLPFAFVAVLNGLTRGTANLSSTGPVVQAALRPRLWGAPPCWHKFAFTGSIAKIRPVRKWAMLTANATTGDKRLYVSSNEWAVKGMTLEVGSNTVANTSLVVRGVGFEVSATGQRRPYIDFTAGLAGSIATSGYALVALYSSTTIDYTPADCNDLIRWLNTTDYFRAEAASGTFTNTLPSTISEVPFKQLSGATVGTSPNLTTGRVTDFVAHMQGGGWAAFVQKFKVVPRCYYLADANATNHATLRDYAIAERVRGYPISIMSGTDWGDVDLSAGDSTSPTWRTAALNSDEFALCANGHNRQSACLSTGPAVWGLRCGYPVGHNLTSDVFVGVEEWEVDWSDADDEPDTLARGGVITNRLDVSDQGPRIVVSQGLTTLQANAGAIWNPEDQTTWSIHQRDIADYIDRVLKFTFQANIVGSDQVTAAGVSQAVYRRVERTLVPLGIVTAFRVTGVQLNDAGSGWDVTWTVTTDKPSDYVSYTTTIYVGPEE